jgi:hypothetical protein
MEYVYGVKSDGKIIMNLKWIRIWELYEDNLKGISRIFSAKAKETHNRLNSINGSSVYFRSMCSQTVMAHMYYVVGGDSVLSIL